jgi:type VI secretion system protein ImpG
MSIRDYFDAEMRLLQEAGEEFAKTYPDQAALLNLNSLSDRDPHIERLLEGFAYLTANIRKRLDDDVPEISAALLQQLWPQILFPFPSATLLEFSWRNNVLQKNLLIPKNTIAISSPIGNEKTIYRFSTMTDFVLQPVKLINVDVSEPSYGGTLFKFLFQSEADELSLNSLKFYLNADFSIATELYSALTLEATKINIVIDGEKYCLGNQNFIVPAHFSENDTLLPLCDRSFYGFHLLMDYFAFREKYLFIEIMGLEKINFSKNTSQFGIEIHTRKTFSHEIKISEKNFKLNCIPAINLYSHLAEPIQMTGKRFSYPLIPEVKNKEGVVLQGIESVEGISHLTGKRQHYEAFSSLRYLNDKKNYYHLLFQESPSGFPQHSLIFNSESNNASDIACQLMVSNGHMPRQHVRENMIFQLIDQPTYLQVKNITRPSPLLLPSTRQEYRWNLISCLSFQLKTFEDKDTLKAVLKLFDWSKREDNTKKIESIYQLETKFFDKFYQGALIRGIEVQLYMKEEGFRSLADLSLFGSVLHAFFAMYAPLNYLIKTRVFAHPSQREFVWKPQLGRQKLL